MNLENILENAKEREISREEALYIFRETRTYDKMIRLFQVASEVRDREVGKIFKLHGFLGPLTPCTVNPPCKYCSQYKSLSVLTLEEFSTGAKLIEETGTKAVMVFGGTVVGSDVTEVVDVVKAIKSVSKLDILIDIGPCLSEETLIELKRLGVKEIGSAFETINKKLFREVKPGDSLETKQKFAETIDSIGLRLYTVMMVGLGGYYSYKDYIDQMFYLKRFKNLCLRVGGFNPSIGTPLKNHPPASPLETARTAAIARLILRDIDIRIAVLDSLSLSILSGGNRAYLGASIYKAGAMRRSSWFVGERKIIDDLELFNPLPAVTKFVREAGMKVG
ncbi:radical SAM protein [Methanococcoides sp.]|uniref:radical SAM protein n=1 Tax=Methanococcoides sp. TaxID=1966350 RepID=UPI00272E73D7|nr:radical SAM protein [Methanococcoides sp.]